MAAIGRALASTDAIHTSSSPMSALRVGGLQCKHLGIISGQLQHALPAMEAPTHR